MQTNVHNIVTNLSSFIYFINTQLLQHLIALLIHLASIFSILKPLCKLQTFLQNCPFHDPLDGPT